MGDNPGYCECDKPGGPCDYHQGLEAEAAKWKELYEQALSVNKMEEHEENRLLSIPQLECDIRDLQAESERWKNSVNDLREGLRLEKAKTRDLEGRLEGFMCKWVLQFGLLDRVVQKEEALEEWSEVAAALRIYADTLGSVIEDLPDDALDSARTVATAMGFLAEGDDLMDLALKWADSEIENLDQIRTTVTVTVPGDDDGQ